MGGTRDYLDVTAFGREEEREEPPEGCPRTPPYEWWNRHDAYDENEAAEGCLAQTGRGPRGRRG